MKRLFFSFLFILFPALVLASSNPSFNNPTGITFAPPPGDVSVVFLGDLFGIVDGVIHGSGSQILGSIFAVFNTAVLALGGMIIMYTLLVSTINTANEGKMLGQKWSSVWVPTRTTLGLALLIPKASGYCLMQIFVMWIVVQGVGAADKIWSAALSYISRGGVIVQPQVNPMQQAPTLGPSSSTILPTGAAKILTGQVCMYGLQTALEGLRTKYLNEKQHDSGPCFVVKNDFESPMGIFCNNPVPDFISTVSPLSFQKAGAINQTVFNLPMPYFPIGSNYASLNGICGTISWNAFDVNALYANNDPKYVNGVATGTLNVSLTPSEVQTITMSRAVAIQQLYSDLALIAQLMVNNDPQLNVSNTTSNNNTPPPTPAWATQQFGVPYSSGNNLCTSSADNCISWGPVSTTSNSSSPLFTGSEFQNALADYIGIMTPSLNILNSTVQSNIQKAQGQFINQANAQGWMMAGSYFINLAQLNSKDLNTSAIDTDSGLDKSSLFDTSNFLKIIPTDNSDCRSSPNPNLCTWLNGDPKPTKPLINIVNLINNNNSVAFPTFSQPITPISDNNASTTYGYITNSAMLNLGQPGLTPPTFKMNILHGMNPTNLGLPAINFPCGRMKYVDVCMEQILGDVIYNILIKGLFNFFLNMLAAIINTVVLAFLYLPLQGMTQIFQAGVAWLQQPSMNPVLALANMGINFINFANELWIYLLELAVISSIIPWFGIFIMPMLALAMPLLVAWLGTMLAIGFVTAYYIPFLPYMIFTFGSIGWLMAVIEAMVAAPIVALGVTHPEGEGPFGKGEQAIMILMNVFLRPAMMIIGYITAIALSYVAVWVINAGFANVLAYLQDPNSNNTFSLNFSMSGQSPPIKPDSNLGYSGWAGIYAYFFSILIYTSMYLTVVQKSFTLIVVLPDKVLRWIGGQAESAGQETAQWAEDSKGKVEQGGGKTMNAQQQIDKKLSGTAMQGVSKVQDKLSGPGPGVSGQGGIQGGPPSTPSGDDS
ncbi:type IVB secretion system protein DotA [Legionella sp. D16C41]|uniref:type IVB secretion system protein DotA n=1 Tax=Legionella sp. D16C41 TaxID=3402688 RepID=UPI003AF968B9